MPILKSKEIAKMSEKDRKDKLKELKLELVRANVTANRTNAKTKELKRAISRLLTMMNTQKTKSTNPLTREGELKKK
ncbi:MAG: 50S ribosomal protein L29 [Nanoarchaeota archaeon]|nr:50S ribosomal protein L29 [Nanoarchaeota archaeon]MBU1051624.1 50S ribosomal protein L29 [Nanoarchaeota archaeon]MBU1988826.1 50S ribosomal protein L29 [Nanoarchaeota archaeon]